MGRSYSTARRKAADYTHVIVGGGAVGLAVARRLAGRPGTSTLLIERHGLVGTETSSRNSEVIHAGIYYGPDSLKTKLCIKGKEMLYKLCDQQSIPYRRSKKWIIAQDAAQAAELQKTHDFARSIGVPTSFIPLAEVRACEPDVRAQEAVLESPTTGILDSHAYMSFLESDLQSRGGDVACNTIVEGIEPVDRGHGGWNITTKPAGSDELTAITSDVLINSAGLAAVDISNSILTQDRHIKAYFAKGSYFSYTAASPKPQTLLYPAPKAGLGGLGTHLTMDLNGQIRFGPDVEWIDDPNDLTVNDTRLSEAIDEITAYLPGIQRDKVQPDYCGIRPKLGKGSAVARGNGDGFSDFVIRKEHGFEGFVNLLGIESPGLTSSLAIGEMVHSLLYDSAPFPTTEQVGGSPPLSKAD